MFVDDIGLVGLEPGRERDLDRDAGFLVDDYDGVDVFLLGRAAAGLQGLCSAGLADRRWILLSMAFMAGLAIVTLLQATKYFQVFGGFGDDYANLFLADA